jgi:hypothetical protein
MNIQEIVNTRLHRLTQTSLSKSFKSFIYQRNGFFVQMPITYLEYGIDQMQKVPYLY